MRLVAITTILRLSSAFALAGPPNPRAGVIKRPAQAPSP